MKKIILLAAAVIMSVGAASAQDVFQKGDLVFNAGVGIGNSLHTGSGYKSLLPPLSLSGEYGIFDNLIRGKNGSIGVGGYLGYAGSKYEGANWNSKYRNFIVAARGTFHYQFVRNLDTYAGVALGYNIESRKDTGSAIDGKLKDSGSAFYPSFFLGARYWFTPGVGVYTEIGYGISYLNLGVAFRL